MTESLPVAVCFKNCNLELQIGIIVGIDGVRIWSLATLTELSRPVGAGGRGATTALTWVRRQDDTDDALIYGTQIGFLVCWKREETRNQPVSLLLSSHASEEHMKAVGKL